MDQEPFVSIIMSTRNRAQFISRSILSALEQSFKEWELLVMDDGSTDNTPEVMRAWEKKDVRIRYVRLTSPGNIAKASNAGLRMAKGEFVAILDDDDWWIDPEKLAKQIKFLREHPDYIACGGSFIAVNGEGKETGRFGKPETDEAIRRVMLSANAIANSTSMFRRVESGFYDESLTGFADWDFFLRLGTIGKLYNFLDYFLAYRMWGGAGSVMSQRKNVDAALVIVPRYRNDYPGFIKGILLARLHWLYSRLPMPIRRATHSFLSRLKKSLFSQ